MAPDILDESGEAITDEDGEAIKDMGPDVYSGTITPTGTYSRKGELNRTTTGEV